jgi:hypothetical protein
LLDGISTSFQRHTMISILEDNDRSHETK